MQSPTCNIIVPAKALAHNIGLDGSGVTMPSSEATLQNQYDSVPTSHEPHFDFVGTGYEHFDENRKIYLAGIDWQTPSYYRHRLLRKTLKFLFSH